MNRTERKWQVVGVALGLVAAVIGAHGRIAAAPFLPGTDLRMTAGPTGELAVSEETFLTARSLRPGRRVLGRLSLQNQTGSTLAVTSRAVPSTNGFADRLHVRVQAGQDVVADGPLDSLVQGSRPWRVASGGRSDLVVEAWLVATETGVEALALDVALRFDSEPVAP